MHDEVLEFLTWLRDEKGIVLCKALGKDFFDEYVPLHVTLESLLKEYQLCDLNKAAAKLFYAIPGVEEVRREDLAQSVVFWIRYNNLSAIVMDIINAKWLLEKQFPEYLICTRAPRMETLRFGFWESLYLINKGNQ